MIEPHRAERATIAQSRLPHVSLGARKVAIRTGIWCVALAVGAALHLSVCALAAYRAAAVEGLNREIWRLQARQSELKTQLENQRHAIGVEEAGPDLVPIPTHIVVVRAAGGAENRAQNTSARFDRMALAVRNLVTRMLEHGRGNVRG